ncbi:DUF6565 domain-containing protein [Hymenobacter jejuensis]|uniref:DUF6565 domain-containing protein n=1 Tax=Hymenobacter jejuensis TaxID=2502781 RepID=A0A5B7ZVM0_9BACT|nr:DUF6565 domain-containing protein [Hymenobacter jejuensis]QDA58625.1 hypothetical protein FHG12_00260 [Hymenobacter jejuensis]
MLKKILTINALTALLAVGGLTVTQLGCTPNQKKETSQESDKAYNDFKTFVSNAEAKADSVGDETEEAYNNETTQMKSKFDSKVAAVDKYADQYDNNRRQEIEQLRTRYTTAYDKRDVAWRNRPSAVKTTTTTTTKTSSSDNAPAETGKYYKLSNPAASMTAANARSTYENFVKMIKANEDRYEIADWRNINAEWRAMDAKYDEIKKDVSGSDKLEISKEKLKYAAFKSFDKAESRVSQGADLATGHKEEAAAKGGGVEVGQSAKNVGADATNAGKGVVKGAENVGKKVGSAVKGAYKDVKAEVKNTDKNPDKN